MIMKAKHAALQTNLTSMKELLRLESEYSRSAYNQAISVREDSVNLFELFKGLSNRLTNLEVENASMKAENASMKAENATLKNDLQNTNGK